VSEARPILARTIAVTPGPESLLSILERCGIVLDRAQIELLWRYHRLLRRANAELNLTRIHNFENMVLKHYVDSLLVLKFVALPAPLIDMGSGGGLPGIPLKIARPEIPVVLAEHRGARAAFLRDACQALGLEGIEVYAHKLGPDYPAKPGGIISRAVASIPETLDRVAPCLHAGGRMLLMKGPGCDIELAEAQRSHQNLFRLAADHAYTIPGTPHHRRLIVFERLEAEAPQAAPARSRAARSQLVDSFAGIVREITSAANPAFQRHRDLLTGPGIRKHGEAIMAGARVRAEVLAHFSDRVLGWLTGADGPPPPSGAITWFRLSDALFGQLDVAGTHGPLLLVKSPPLPRWSDGVPWPLGCTLFVPFQDPENVGAVIRSAAAFGAPRVVLLRESAHPFHPRSSRAAGPALFQVPLLQGPALPDLQVQSAPLIALDTSGTELGAAAFPETFGLVVGVEGPGLPPGLRASERRRIAMRPGVESLNAAAAAAIALYVWSRTQAPDSCRPPEGIP
jgi:16S rRNA (guanine527-N7)-methyltransferase